MRQEVARMIHHVNRGLAIFDPDVNMQAKDQVGARHQLHILNDVLVSLVGMNLLRAPIGKWMRRHRRQLQAIFPRQADNISAQRV